MMSEPRAAANEIVRREMERLWHHLAAYFWLWPDESQPNPIQFTDELRALFLKHMPTEHVERHFALPDDVHAYLTVCQGDLVEKDGHFTWRALGLPAMLGWTAEALEQGAQDEGFHGPAQYSMQQRGMWVAIARDRERTSFWLCCDRSRPELGAVSSIDDGHPWINRVYPDPVDWVEAPSWRRYLERMGWCFFEEQSTEEGERLVQWWAQCAFRAGLTMVETDDGEELVQSWHTWGPEWQRDQLAYPEERGDLDALLAQMPSWSIAQRQGRYLHVRALHLLEELREVDDTEETRQQRAALAREAVSDLQLAVALFQREGNPPLFARSQEDRGRAWHALARVSQQVPTYEEAAWAYAAALANSPREASPLVWRRIHRALAAVYAEQGTVDAPANRERLRQLAEDAEREAAP
jgi:hypothetical protein